MVLAALLTPSDIGGMLILAIPMMLLYEMAIWVVAASARSKEKSSDPSSDDMSMNHDHESA
jgi:Sec-independent protein secretion pathway component TatC